METILSANSRQQAYAIAEQTQVSSVRRAAQELTTRAGFDETAAGQVALMVTEAATNILKHAGHGEILLRPLSHGDVSGIEIIAIDNGPGMRDLAANMEDGTSSAGSYGVGLGAMRRLSSEFDVYTAPGKGTVLHMRAWAGPAPAQCSLQLGVICLPMAGETACGDSWGVACAPTEATLMMADGLGHGLLAEEASRSAVRALANKPRQPPSMILDDAHAMLRTTRGAAVAVAQIDMHAEQLRYAGVGNIACHVFNGAERKQMVSHNGIVGSNMRKVQEFTIPWNPGAMLVLHSDGLGSRWDLDQYPRLAMHHPAVIAAVLYRDFSRGRDDVNVMVALDLQHLPQ